MINKKNRNLIIIGVIVVVIAYFLFFKQKEGFKAFVEKVKKEEMMKHEAMMKARGMKSVMDTCKDECPEKLISNSGEFIAVFDPNTGNLSVQHVKGKILWQSNSRNRGQGPYRLFMQMDGNLVIYDRNKKPTWASNTGGKGKGPFRIVMQDDYNLVIYGLTGPTWASRSA